MTANEIYQRIKSARKLVQTWPAWKQNILVQSAQPTVKVPRTPVNNQMTTSGAARLLNERVEKNDQCGSAADIMKRAGVTNMLEGRTIRLNVQKPRAEQMKAQCEQSQKTWGTTTPTLRENWVQRQFEKAANEMGLLKLIEDLDRFYELVDDADFEKLKIQNLKVGQKIGWWYKDTPDQGDDRIIYQGIIIARPGTENISDLEPEDCVVVVTEYPTEKCYAMIDWVTLGLLLSNKDLAEVVEIYPQIIREVL